MGDVGDELGLHPLGLHLLLHGVLDASAEVVEVFAVFPELAVEAVGGHLVVQVAGGQLVPAGPDLLHGQDDIDHQDALQDLEDAPNQHRTLVHRRLIHVEADKL